MDCANCAASALHCCSGCDRAYYCSARCQKEDWAEHKARCKVGAFPESRPKISELAISDYIINDTLEALQTAGLEERFDFWYVEGAIESKLEKELLYEWEATTRGELQKSYLTSLVAKSRSWVAVNGPQSVLTLVITAKMRRRKPKRGEDPNTAPNVVWRIVGFAIMFISWDRSSALLSVIGARDLQHGVAKLRLGKLIHFIAFAMMQDLGVQHLYLEAANRVRTTEEAGDFSDINSFLAKFYLDLLYKISATDCRDGESDWRSRFPGLTDPPRTRQELEQDTPSFKLLTTGANGLAMSWCDLDKTKLENEARRTTRDIITILQQAERDGVLEEFFYFDDSPPPFGN